MNDKQLRSEARRFLLKGEGVHEADGAARFEGYFTITVKAVGKTLVDVEFAKGEDPFPHCHIEFSATGSGRRP